MAVLVVTNETDVTADYLIERAYQRSIHVFRLNTERLAEKFSYFLSLSDSGTEMRLSDALERTIQLADITGVWYRRPVPPVPVAVAPEHRSYVAGEYLALIRGILPEEGVTWMSHPLHIARAENKLYQLYLARRLGFTIPRTVISNRGCSINQAMGSRRCIIKPLMSGFVESERGRTAYYTTLAPRLDSLTDGELSAAPVLIQELIERAFDVRLTVVRDSVFAARVDCRGPHGSIDWRESANSSLARFSRMQAPSKIAQQCVAMLRALNLGFGAFDFIVDSQGMWCFLEINPNGQWAWLDPYFDGGIGDAIIGTLSVADARHVL